MTGLLRLKTLTNKITNVKHKQGCKKECKMTYYKWQIQGSGAWYLRVFFV